MAKAASLLLWVQLLLIVPAWHGMAAAAPAPDETPQTVRLGVLKEGWPPFSIVQNGQVSGISAEFLRAAFGDRPVHIVTTVYADAPALLEAVCANRVDVALSIAETAKRSRCLRFSAPYFDANTVVIGRAAEPHSVDLAHARIAVERGFFMDEQLRGRFPQARFVLVKDAKAGLHAIRDNRADYYPTLQPVADYYLQRPENTALAVRASYLEPGGALRFAFSPAAGALQAQVDQGIFALSPDSRRSIIGRWVTPSFPHQTAPKEVFLTSAERAYLRSLPVLRVAFDAASAPYSYIDEGGQPNGMAADYLAYLGHTLGVRFLREKSAPFAEAVAALRQGKSDLMAVAAVGDPALAGVPVTRPYATFPLVIVGRQSAVAVEGPRDLIGMRVVVFEGSGVAGILQAVAPDLQVTNVSSVHAGMDAVATGQADAYVDDLATVDGELQRNYAGTLHIIGSGQRTVDMGFALSPELDPQLLSIINRAMANMPESERRAISSRYIAASYASEASWQQVLERIAPYLLLAGLAAAILLRSHVQLRREASARLRAQQALQAQLDFQRRLIDAIPIPIAVRDAEGRYVETNAAFQNIAGMTREQMLGHKAAEVDVPGGRVSRALDEGFLRGIEDRELHQFAVDFLDGEGKHRHFLVWVQAITDTGAEITRVISAAVDVTDIRHAEEQARAAEAMLIDVTRHLPAAVFRIREREGLFEHQWVSGNARELFDRPAVTLIDQIDPLRDLINPEDRLKLVAATVESRATKATMNVDMRLLVRGQVRWIRVHAVPQSAADGSVLWHGYYADVTKDREHADDLAQAKDAAEAASRAKDGFLAMMSHEIRTPMNGILGLIELLQRTSLTLEQRHMLALAGESGQALAQILDDILDYAKLEAGRMTILQGPVDLRELFDKVLDSLLPQALQKGLRLKQWVAAEVPAEVQVDGIRMRQILFNLLGNAIKFTEHGSVMLRVGLEEHESVPVLVVSVEDTGIGISKADIDRLFAPFVQSELSTTRRFGGTGLGLAISKKLAAMMDGEIGLDSWEGAGTVATLRVPCVALRQDYDIPGLKQRALAVRVDNSSRRAALIAYGMAAGMHCLGPDETLPDDGVLIDEACEPAGEEGRFTVHLTDEFLPLGYRQHATGTLLGTNPLRWSAFVGALQAELQLVAPAALDSAAEDTAGAPAPRGPVVLIVEDHPINQDVIRWQLQSLGYDSVLCANGQEAWEALLAGTFDLVLTDCHMPVMDGFDLTRRIRASDRPALREIPVVGLTATIAREEHALCTEVGMNTFLLKPTELATLQQALEGALPARTAPPPDTSSRHGASGLDGFQAERIDSARLLSHLADMLMEADSRQKFRRALVDDRETLRMHLDGPLPGDLGKWCHRAGGALSTFDQPYLVERAQRLGALCKTGTAAEIRAAGAGLLDMYDYLLDLLAPLGTP